MPTDVLIVAIIFAIVSVFCLGWMLRNLLRVNKQDGLSGQFEKRMEQTKAILLKPALCLFAVGGLCSLYLAFRGEWMGA